MTISKQRTLYLTLFISLLIIAVFIFSLPLSSAKADGEEVKVDLNNNSLFSYFGNTLAYTSSTSLFIVHQNTIVSLSNAFEGDALSLAMDSANIYIVVQTTEGNKCYSYNYTNSSISAKESVVFAPSIGDADAKTIFSVNVINSKIYYMRPGAVYSLNDSGSTWSPAFHSTNSLFANASRFLILNNTLYLLVNSSLYSTTLRDDSTNTTLSDPILTEVKDIALLSNTIVASFTGSIKKLNQENNLWEEMTTSSPTSFSHIAVYSNTLLGMENNSIKRYSVHTDDSLEFNRLYDNELYEYPTKYDVLKYGEITQDCKIYVSPKNLEIKVSLVKGSFAIVLCDIDPYYYVYYNGEMGFILKENMTVYNQGEATLGLNAQPLHDNMPIYEYPFSTSNKLIELGVDDIVTIRSNVSQKEDIMISEYYEVSYINSLGDVITGYAKATHLAAYTDYKAPTSHKNARVQVDIVGTTAKTYLLPDTTSDILYSLNDGDEVGLLEEFNKENEWTKILVNNQTCYILTSNLVYKSLTKMQITLIIILSLLVVSAMITACVLHARKVILRKQNMD